MAVVRAAGSRARHPVRTPRSAAFYGVLPPCHHEVAARPHEQAAPWVHRRAPHQEPKPHGPRLAPAGARLSCSFGRSPSSQCCTLASETTLEATRDRAAPLAEVRARAAPGHRGGVTPLGCMLSAPWRAVEPSSRSGWNPPGPGAPKWSGLISFCAPVRTRAAASEGRTLCKRHSTLCGQDHLGLLWGSWCHNWSGRQGRGGGDPAGGKCGMLPPRLLGRCA